MTVKDAAKRLGLHPCSVYEMIAAGKLAHRRIGPRGGKIVIDAAEVERYWEEATVAPPGVRPPPTPKAARAPGSDWRERLAALEARHRAKGRA